MMRWRMVRNTVVTAKKYTVGNVPPPPKKFPSYSTAIDRLMIELLDFHIPFLSFTNAGFKGYGKNLLNRRLRITLLPQTLIHFRHFILTSSFILVSSSLQSTRRAHNSRVGLSLTTYGSAYGNFPNLLFNL